MNLKRLFSFIVISGTILNVSQAVAQLKVGSNPASINTNTNLEAESTDGTRLRVNADNGNVGMGTTVAPTNKLHVNGTDPLRLEGVQASGSAGDKLLLIDATGVVKTQTTGTKGLIVSAAGGPDLSTVNGNIPNNSFFVVPLSEVSDPGNLYNPATNTFTAGENGLYTFSSHFLFNFFGGTFDGSNGKLWGAYKLNGGGQNITSFTSIFNGSFLTGINYQSANTNITLYLAAGETVQLGCLFYGLGTTTQTQNSIGGKDAYVKIYRLL